MKNEGCFVEHPSHTWDIVGAPGYIFQWSYVGLETIVLCFCPPSQYCNHFTLWEIFSDDEETEESLDKDTLISENKNVKLSIDEVYSSSENEQVLYGL